PREEVDRVIRMAGLEDLIREKGEDYLCGENGNGLSGGEKQRISIARALLRNTKVLLVDEATAALDAETSNKVINAILNLEDITRIIVTHDLDESTLRKYDSILTLKGGEITEEGDFETLMQKKGYFYSLFMLSQ
ncbi:MAG: ATP-binding cassette domain-containing protein, partial [Lachnospiraceae bacterium]|nr:ATP-binding cassette domain-containing protein [Lachnospiraceae bacterium]